MDIARETALKVIYMITQKGAFSGQELDKALSSVKELKDKAFITELVYGTIDKLYTVDRIIETYSKVPLDKLESIVLSILRMATFQLKYLDKVPSYAVINEAVNQVKKESPGASGFVNGILRNINRSEKDIRFKGKTDKLSYDYSMPLWITEKLMEDYPKNVKGILSALSKTHGVTLRINTLKITSEEYEKLLDEKEKPYQKGKVTKESFYLPEPGDVKKLPGFNEGLFAVQNESASLVSLLLFENIKKKNKNKDEENKNEEIKVLDICAAPGGKTQYLYELLNKEIKEGEFSIRALDIHEHRVKLMENNFKRLGYKDIKTGKEDATVFNPKYENEFHGIIADVPCSGLGISGRKPDIKINISEESMAEMMTIQRKILENCAKYLKENGYLMYSTCTLNRDENERNITSFLSKHEEFILVDLKIPEGRNNIINNSSMYTIMPDDTMDGFFFALLKKESSVKES